ncbi:hypothetical protein [Methylobacterium nodulans]|uniref:Uncharacterized protein n=1 Tax=Methylobacterium nodulans (strain LMG 21967 / CNCM I-2342 / ORS 2060) TaxID=460265 RepID=B8IST5_METNO|nr:hypothetical protein [Methylobacterium nodulans]ACL60734.1 hypothetical protein Mnod_5906 [Methylobacterium nodulans ORS 2060]
MALSDKALSVFAFAAYHQLDSGQKVSRVLVSEQINRTPYQLPPALPTPADETGRTCAL